MCHFTMVGNISCKLAMSLNLSATKDEQSFQYSFFVFCFYLCCYTAAESRTKRHNVLTDVEQSRAID